MAAVGIGQAIERFDWTAYTLLAVYFSSQFSQRTRANSPRCWVPLVFSPSAFIVRPIWGLLVGVIADVFGRKTALLLTIYGMVAAGLVIEATPDI